MRVWLTAGLAAALLSSLPGIAWVLARSEPWWRPVQAIASLVGFDRLDAISLPALTLGVLIHLLLSLAYAAPVVLVARRIPTPLLLVVGAVWGLAVWTANFPIAKTLGWFETLRGATDARLELVAHLTYGVTLAVTAALLLRRERDV